ncbi:MAG: nucleoside hydrolase, partial [Patescibacteria group bacterium]
APYSPFRMTRNLELSLQFPGLLPLPALAVVDNTNPDNEYQVLSMMSRFFDLKGVIVTGRAAGASREADLLDISQEESEFRTILNAVRMLNCMDAVVPGHNIPVFAGTPAPETIVPHSVHVDELDFNDLKEGQLERIRNKNLADARSLGSLGLAGNIKSAVSYAKSSEVGDFTMVVGGPMTDVDKMLRHDSISEKTMSIHTQFGMCGFGEHKLMEFGGQPRGKRQFNVACDVRAARRVLGRFPKDINLYPSDVTRVDSIGFANAQELAAFLPKNAKTRRMTEIYDFAFREMIQPRGPHEKIWIHDIAPAIGALNLAAYRRLPTGRNLEFIRGPYAQRAVHVRHVPYKEAERQHFGEIWLSFIEDASEIPDTHRRFVADSVDADLYKQTLYELSA